MKQTQLFAIFFALATSVAQGQIWTEIGDAPAGLPGHQDTMGVGPLTTIEGSLDAVIDHVDTYSIEVTDAMAFSAMTTSVSELLADSRLWMWTDTTLENGAGLVMANDDNPGGGLSSLLTDPSTWPGGPGSLINTPGSLVNGGRYLLSISYFANDPNDDMGTPLADFPADFTALHGPDPAAGPFDSWEDPGTAGNVGAYTILLEGATFSLVPEPATLITCCWILLPLGLYRRISN